MLRTLGSSSCNEIANLNYASSITSRSGFEPVFFRRSQRRLNYSEVANKCRCGWIAPGHRGHRGSANAAGTRTLTLR